MWYSVKFLFSLSDKIKKNRNTITDGTEHELYVEHELE